MSQSQENVVSLLEHCSRVREEEPRQGAEGRSRVSDRAVLVEHAAAAAGGHGDGQRAEEHAGGAGQQGDRGRPIREHRQRTDHW